MRRLLDIGRYRASLHTFLRCRRWNANNSSRRRGISTRRRMPRNPPRVAFLAEGRATTSRPRPTERTQGQRRATVAILGISWCVRGTISAREEIYALYFWRTAGSCWAASRTETSCGGVPARSRADTRRRLTAMCFMCFRRTPRPLRVSGGTAGFRCTRHWSAAEITHVRRGNCWVRAMGGRRRRRASILVGWLRRAEPAIQDALRWAELANQDGWQQAYNSKVRSRRSATLPSSCRWANWWRSTRR